MKRIHNGWVRGLLKMVLAILLIPVLLFGGAYGYGTVCRFRAQQRAAAVLQAHRAALEQVCAEAGEASGMLGWIRTKAHPQKLPQELTDAGMEGMETDGDAVCIYFERGLWVPCGLMHAPDVSQVEHWRKTKPLDAEWYFFWDV